LLTLPTPRISNTYGPLFSEGTFFPFEVSCQTLFLRGWSMVCFFGASPPLPHSCDELTFHVSVATPSSKGLARASNTREPVCFLSYSGSGFLPLRNFLFSFSIFEFAFEGLICSLSPGQNPFGFFVTRRCLLAPFPSNISPPIFFVILLCEEMFGSLSLTFQRHFPQGFFSL